MELPLIREELIKTGDLIEYLIDTDLNKEVSLDFMVYKVTSWTLENAPIDSELELFIRGSIKWDGCSNIYFGNESGYFHLCSRACFYNISKVLDAVWRKAENEIINFCKNTAY